MKWPRRRYRVEAAQFPDIVRGNYFTKSEASRAVKRMNACRGGYGGWVLRDLATGERG